VSDQDWILFLLIVVLYAVFAGWLGRFSVTMPMVLVVAGALTGPDVLGLIDIPTSAAGVERVAEVTLSLLLFADAASLDLGRLRHHAGLAGRLLLIGLPLTVILGAFTAFSLYPHLGLGFALLVAAILAPSDAALVMPTLGDRHVPARIQRVLRIESGLNDGLAAPLVALFVALTLEGQRPRENGWLLDALSQVGLAVAVGAAIGLVGGRLFAAAVANHWTTPVAERFGNLALALGIFWAAHGVGGNVLVAAFVGGLAFGAMTHTQLHGATEFTEIAGTIFSIFIWTVFGANLVVPILRAADARAVVFAIVALTLVRMIPVALSMLGSGLRPDTVLVMGWLGPRGLPSIILMLIAYEALHGAEPEASTLTTVVSWAIVMSVLLHALTGSLLTRWYARRLETAPPGIPEMLPRLELPADYSPR
jgi:NhaP-type Na+/H+ or K+/H+ antiporter